MQFSRKTFPVSDIPVQKVSLKDSQNNLHVKDEIDGKTAKKVAVAENFL